MDADEFWFFLERSARESGSPQGRTGWLEDKLSRVSRAHVVDFQAHLDAARRPIDTYAMWGAAYQITDGLCSGEWSDAEWPWWEDLAYVARRVHDHLTGQEDSIYHALAERGLRSPHDPAPEDRPWDFDSPAEIQRHLPRIAAMFPRRRYLKG